MMSALHILIGIFGFISTSVFATGLEAQSQSIQISAARRQIGTVKWYNPVKGYGFIVPRTGDRDVFVRAADLARSGLSTLTENQVVEYEVIYSRRYSMAVNIVILRN